MVARTRLFVKLYVHCLFSYKPCPSSEVQSDVVFCTCVWIPFKIFRFLSFYLHVTFSSPYNIITMHCCLLLQLAGLYQQSTCLHLHRPCCCGCPWLQKESLPWSTHAPGEKIFGGHTSSLLVRVSTGGFLRRFIELINSSQLEIKWNANLMQIGNFIDVILARHVSGTYTHHQEH